MRNFLMSTSKFESKTISTHRKQFLSKYKITRTHFYSQPTTQSFSCLITEAFHIDVFFNYSRATRNYYFTEHSFINNLSLFRLRKFKIDIKYIDSPKGFQDEFDSCFDRYSSDFVQT